MGDPKIPPIDLLAQDFKEKLNEHKSDRAKASEIENAIKHHIKVNIEEDPEYYRPLSDRLMEIIQKGEEKWEVLVQMLMDFRDHIEVDRKKGATDLGLSETEYAFHNILMTEVTKQNEDDIVDESTHLHVIEVVKQLVDMMEEATSIVGFFSKWDEQKRVKKKIKRTILAEGFGNKALVGAITERFMELAEVKFK